MLKPLSGRVESAEKACAIHNGSEAMVYSPMEDAESPGRFTKMTNNEVITARIRRMREGNIFTLCVSPHLDGGGGGGTPSLSIPVWGGGGYLIKPWMGGTPIQPWTGGTPTLDRGGTPAHVWGGTPPPE